ncbi:MAG: Fe-S cluster assembly protein SufD [bacterium]|nr:Fe-S cluster assembly protein SufD [bacterium]
MNAEDQLRNLTADPALPGWFNTLRLEAAASYFELPLPDRTDEAWHYGDPKRFLPDALAPTAPRPSTVAPEALDAIRADGGVLLSLDNPDIEPNATALAERGVVHLSLREALVKHGDMLQPVIEDAWGRHRTRKLSAAHFGLLEHGALLLLKRSADPQQSLHFYSAGAPAGTVFCPRLIVLAEQHSRASIYVHWHDEPSDSRSVLLAALQARLGEGSDISIVQVQQHSSSCNSFLRGSAKIERDARLRSVTVLLGTGAMMRRELHVELDAPGASAEMYGTYVARGKQRLDLHTHQLHNAPHTTSKLLVKGALFDRSRASFSGMIGVAADAQRTDAYQSNRALVLSGSARADSSPQLEIGANDVRCTHGSTVSNVSEGEMFYMQSRGIQREVARRLLVAAFIGEVIDQIGSAPVRAQVERYVAELGV